MNPAAPRGRSTSPATLQQRGCCPVLPFLTRPNSSPLACFASRRMSPILIGFHGMFTPPRAIGLPLQLPSSSVVVALFFPSSPAPTPHPQPPPPRRTSPIWSSSTASPAPPSPYTSSHEIWIGVQQR